MEWDRAEDFLPLLADELRRGSARASAGTSRSMEQSEQPNDTSPEAVTGEPEGHKRKATVRQLLHWATGDRDAEAKALADASDAPVSERAAKVAVQAAHGDIPSDKSHDDSEVAKPIDAEALHELYTDND